MNTKPHLRGVMVSNELIIQMMTEGWSAQFVECRQGLPYDAEYLYTYHHPREVIFVFSHPSFPECDLGSEPELTYVTFGRFFYPDVDALLKQHIEEDKAAA